MSLNPFKLKLCEKCGTYMVPHQKLNGYLKCHSCGYQKMENPIITKYDYITASGKYPEREKNPELTSDISKNADKWLDKVNAFLYDIGINSVIMSSGFRPSDVNEKTSNAAKNSTHLTCEGGDIQDLDGKIRDTILKNLDKAKQYGLYFEDFRWTPTWCHIQTKPPGSGKRIYIPSTKPAIKPDAWSGIYDKKFD